jgi:hypothetical protein
MEIALNIPTTQYKRIISEIKNTVGKENYEELSDSELEYKIEEFIIKSLKIYLGDK